MRLLPLLILIAFWTIGQSHAQYRVLSAIVPSETGDVHLLVNIFERNCEAEGWNASYSNTLGQIRGCWYRDGELIKIKVPGENELKVFPFSEFKFMGIRKSQEVKAQTETKPLTTLLTCAAEAWVGEILIEREGDGKLKSINVSGEPVSANEQANAINFTYKGLNISLSTLTGAFNYETSGFQKYLNNRLLGGGSTKGTGLCKINTGEKKF